ncbi:MAG: hypothetical protein ACK4UT_02435, partial [Moraxellaceae bacterium]
MAKQAGGKKANNNDAADDVKAEKVKPAAPKVRKEHTLLLAGVPMLVIMALLLLAMAGGLYAFLSQEAQKRRGELAQVYRQHFVAVTNDFLRSHEAMLQAHEASALLATLDGTALVRDVSPQFPGATAAQLVAAGIDVAMDNGLGYAQQDMAVRALKGDKVAPEINYYRDEQVVTYARPLLAEGRVAAVLLLSVPFKPLATSLKSYGTEAGRVELSQLAGKEKAVIVRTSEGLAVDESAAPAATVNPGWELRFLPAQTLGAMQGLLWVVVGAMTLAALLA